MKAETSTYEKGPVYEVVSPKTGVVKEYPFAMRPIAAKRDRLAADGSEILRPDLLVNPLHIQPSIKSMVQAAERSGRLLQLQRMSENLQLAEDDDPRFEGYSRDWLEQNFMSVFEADFLLEQLPEAPADGSEAPPPAPHPPSTEGAPAPSGGEATQ